MPRCYWRHPVRTTSSTDSTTCWPAIRTCASTRCNSCPQTPPLRRPTCTELLAQILYQPVALPPMMDRHGRVPVSVEEEQRNRADRLYHGQRTETVVHGERRDPLKRPGEPVVGEFFPGDLDVAGERALYDEGADAIAKRRVCDVVHRERAAKALAVDNDAVLVYVLAREQRSHRGVDVFLRALQVGPAFGCAVAAVVEDEHVEAARGHPGDAGEVSADVLRVAVQVQDRAERAAFRGQEPAVQLEPVLRLKARFPISEPQLVGRVHQDAVRLKEELRATGDQHGREDGCEATAHAQK